MLLREAFLQTKRICYPPEPLPVERTVTEAIATHLAPQARPVTALAGKGQEMPGTFSVSVLGSGAPIPEAFSARIPTAGDWLLFEMDPSGAGRLLVSHAHLLFALYAQLRENWLDQDVERFRAGHVARAAFRWCPDSLLNNELTLIARGFDAESYVQECARLGYSHLAVNGLATVFPMEPWTPGEVYPLFYRHNAALDQFVSSRLNKGIYPEDYLRANLSVLKQNADLVLRYGITPGFVCYAPRSVPDELLRRYPMLRGARVDHPFRSYKPRYNLCLAHPVVRDHYAELAHNLLQQVPALGYLTIYSNDSGSGFEHTRTLYAGRNGGAYLIREWKDDDEIAKAAGQNAVRFARVLREAAAQVNPDFRVILNMGPFTTERPAVWRGLGDGVDPEDAHTLISVEDRQDLEARGAMAHLSAPTAPGFGPLIGVPCPWLLYENLEHLVAQDIDVLAHAGQVATPSMAPWCVNHEVWRAVHLSWPVDPDRVVSGAAERWVGPDLAGRLVEGWRGADEAARAYSPRLYLYGSFGFVLYRLWVRPLVPDIEAIPEADRAYYEEFMLTTWNNPTRVDLSRDVLFQLNTPDEALSILRQMDAHCWAPLDAGLQILADTATSLSESDPARRVFEDQRDRLRALRCYLRTQRNVAAWIAGVPGYLQASDPETRAERRQLLREMIDREIENTQDLIELCGTCAGIFMLTSTRGENPYFYADNLSDLLRRRIELMRDHQDDEPYIDPDFMWRVPGIRDAPSRTPG